MRHHLPRTWHRQGAALKKYANSLHFREQAKVFDSPSTVDDIVVAGENALVSLYGGKPGEKLDGMRYQRYCEKLATNSSQIQPQNLPPTSAAARHHSLRVYLQVKQWKGENEGMSLEDYGWKVTEGQVLPRMTDLPAAPESLLQMIRCNCLSDCASARCTCRKHGLHVANAEVRRVQILQSSLTKMTAKMSKRVKWKRKHESHKII